VPVVLEGHGFRQSLLAGCQYFMIEKVDVHKRFYRELDRGFMAATVIQGRGTLAAQGRTVEVFCGETLLLPAALGSFEAWPAEGVLSMVLSRVPASLEKLRGTLSGLGVSPAQMQKLGGLS
jgi:mannose-6-phosphate isomerase class I